MIFIVSFIVLAVLVTTFLLLCSGGIILFSGDKQNNLNETPFYSPKIEPVKTEHVKVKQKAYIDLNGRLIELQSKSEETKAKKDGYNVVYK